MVLLSINAEPGLSSPSVKIMGGQKRFPSRLATTISVMEISLSIS
jgi:hypothetical protein